MRRAILMPLLVTIAVGGILGGIALWAYNTFTYYWTNDAQIQTNLVSITAPQAGTVNNIKNKGDTVNVNDQIATLQVQGNNGTSTINLNTPVGGTVFAAVANGSTVTRGYPVAVVNQTGTNSVGEAKVVAFVDEGVLDRVRIGQQADVHIDGYGSTLYTGRVEQIIRQAASQITGVPISDYASGNFTKVSQRVPVLVSLDAGTVNNDLLQGLNAEVRIHLL